MADSIHDQWPAATDEWARVSAQFQAAWLFIYNAYDVNTDYAAFAAGIGYLSRLHMDASVMAGNMITQLAITSGDNTRGLIQNFQNLQRHVLPQWGAVAAAYATSEATILVAAEAQQRIVAETTEFQQRALGDQHSREQAAAAVLLESQLRAFADAYLQKTLTDMINAEAQQRALGDQHSREQAAAGINALNTLLSAQIANVLKYAQSLPALVDQRAAAGYDPTLRARGGLIQKILDTVVAHDPAVASLVTNLAKWAVDLAGIEDPLVKVAAQLVLKQVIGHLGVDSALTAILNDLLGGILGGGQPKTLQDIMGDIGNRLDALESSVSELSPLTPEADDLHELGTLLFDAALLAYFTAAVADPAATANDTVDVLGTVTGPLLAPVRALLGM